MIKKRKRNCRIFAAQALACPCRDLEQLQDARALQQEWLEQLEKPPQPLVVEGLRHDSRVHRELLSRWLGH